MSKSCEAVTDEEKLLKFITSLKVTPKELKWEDLQGLSNIKLLLEQSILLPNKFPEIFTGQRKTFKSLLMFGPPGSGKSYIVEIAASELNAYYLKITSGSLRSPGFESSRIIQGIFRIAREHCPSIIFFDESDSYMRKRSENDTTTYRDTLNEILVQLQDVLNEDFPIIVIAASNIPWELDNAILRRFQKKILVKLPDSKTRQQILMKLMSGTDHNICESDFQMIANNTQRFSAAELQNLCQTASMEAVTDAQTSSYFKLTNEESEKLRVCNKQSENAIEMSINEIPDEQLTLPPVSITHFTDILKKMNPKVDEAELQKFNEFAEAFGND